MGFPCAYEFLARRGQKHHRPPYGPAHQRLDKRQAGAIRPMQVFPYEQARPFALFVMRQNGGQRIDQRAMRGVA
ncbi:hypothetical protein D3C72_2441250 [compost metagenome]